MVMVVPPKVAKAFGAQLWLTALAIGYTAEPYWTSEMVCVGVGGEIGCVVKEVNQFTSISDDDDAVDTEDDDADDTEDEDAAADSDDDDSARIGFAGKVASQSNAGLQNKQVNIVGYDSEPDDDTDDDENYLQKFDESLHTQVIADYHPEMKSHNYDEITNLSKVTRNESGAIIDPLHKSVPFITRYEKAKLIGERATQLGAGAKPLVEVDDNIIDDYVIALKEFNEKKIPFIIKRPMPNGGCEYWRMEDLEILM